LIDFKEKTRSPDNMVFGIFDYFDKSDCEKAIKYLETGKMELLKRNKAELCIDMARTVSK
jgi:hypothetical protein